MTVWISELAERDLLEIWQYTAAEWSEQQADVYVEAFAAQFSLLAAQPGAGHSIDEVRPDYRRSRQGSHLIFYRPKRDGIEVIRILHEKMDPTLHL
ncbi:type II toxin-antitoxin system RelE/ParE family toxin [Corynebacterium bouchesdurhonense]|uniref:type II toxin-antitoxin system RelE/ParE family toxin n=1 Tax=Corynebacterium bouchesdurhonense TaxID=1720192 RepID=UPI00082BFDFB|nr:type II toxin-antitoxin system RelE/ParE family toxin [Corynebacterium bouchesdurhonense]